MEKTVAATAFTKIEITSDGTREGTAIKLNGKEIPNLQVLGFTFWNDDYGNNVSLDFSTRDAGAEPGTLSQTTYWRLVPPAKEADPANAASIQPGGTIPPDRLPRGERRNLYAQI